MTGMRSARTPCMPLKVKHSLSERRQPERTLDREAGSHPVARAALRSAAPKIDCLPQSHLEWLHRVALKEECFADVLRTPSLP